MLAVVVLATVAVLVPVVLTHREVAAYGYQDDGGWGELQMFSLGWVLAFATITAPVAAMAGLLRRWGHPWWATLLGGVGIAVGAWLTFGLGFTRFWGSATPLLASNLAMAVRSYVLLLVVCMAVTLVVQRLPGFLAS